MDYESNESIDHLALARDLVEIMRVESNLSYGHSQCCVESVVSQINKTLRIPALEPVIDALNKDVLDVENCSDATRLESTLETLSSFKEEWQQRSWSLYEDQDSIISSLEELGSLIKLADRRVSLAALSKYDFKRIHDLVEFYQMETRLVIRCAILSVMKLVCLLSQNMVSVLLPTVLPLELARDIISDQTKSNDETTKLHISLENLTLLFSTAEMLPYTHYDVLNMGFVNALLKLIENDEAKDSCLTLAMKTLIAFNLHFTDPESNMLIQSLSQQECSKKFSERLLLMCNKEESLWSYEKTEAPYPSGVVKLLQDIFSNKGTSKKLFYSNDAAVLADIVLREVADLNPGKLRSEYLSLMQLILVQSNIMDSRTAEVSECLKQLDLTDDGSYPSEDYIIIKDIRRQLASLV